MIRPPDRCCSAINYIYRGGDHEVRILIQQRLADL